MALQKDVLKSVIHKPVTRPYPQEADHPSGLVRGQPHWDSAKCIGCHQCERNCPAQAIIIQGKRPTIEFFLDLGRCVFCGQCAQSCRPDAITMGSDIVSASLNRTTLKIHQKQTPIDPSE